MAFITVLEASARAGLHRQTIADALREGKLHGGQRVKRGSWRIQEECLDSWLMGDKCIHRAPVKRAA